MKRYLFILLTMLLVCTSCIGTSKVKFINIPDNVPDWVNKKEDFWEDNHFFYLKSVIDSDNISQDEEKVVVMYAQNQMAEQIKQKIQTELIITYSETDINYLQLMKDTFQTKIDGLIITGIEVVGNHKQIVIFNHRGGEVTKYRYYCLIRISEDNYRKALNQTI